MQWSKDKSGATTVCRSTRAWSRSWAVYSSEKSTRKIKIVIVFLFWAEVIGNEKKNWRNCERDDIEYWMFRMQFCPTPISVASAFIFSHQLCNAREFIGISASATFSRGPPFAWTPCALCGAIFTPNGFFSQPQLQCTVQRRSCAVFGTAKLVSWKT